MASNHCDFEKNCYSIPYGIQPALLGRYTPSHCAPPPLWGNHCWGTHCDQHRRWGVVISITVKCVRLVHMI